MEGGGRGLPLMTIPNSGAVTKFENSVDTFGSNRKLHKVMKVLNYRFNGQIYLVSILTHSVHVENFLDMELPWNV